MKNKTNEELILELKDLQQKYDSLKALHKESLGNGNIKGKITEEVPEPAGENKSIVELAFDHVNMAWWEMETETGNVSFHRRKSEMLGLPAERFKHYSDFTSLLHPEDYLTAMNSMSNHLAGKTPVYDTEYRILASSGEYKWFHDIGALVKSEGEGNSSKVVGFVMDITARKQADLEKQSVLQAITKSAQDGIVMLDINGNISFWNDAAASIFGFMQDEIIGKKLHDFVIPEPDRDCFIDDFRIFQQSSKGASVRKTFEFTAKRKDGFEFPVELALSAVRFQNQSQSIGIIHDIASRKQTENALRISEEKYRKIFESVRDVYIQTNKEGIIVEISPSIKNLFQYSREELIGIPVGDFYYDPGQRQAMFNELFEKGEVLNFELLLKTKDGNVSWVSLNANYHYDNEGRMDGIEGIFRDIDHHKRSDENIRKQAELLNMAHDSIIIKDMDFKITYWNQGAARRYGWTAEEVLGKRMGDMVVTLFPVPVEEIKSALLNAGYWDGELIQYRKDCTKIIVQSRWQLHRDASNKPHSIFEINYDITERKATEEALKKSEATLREINATKDKFFSIIAHDLRNPLSAILGLLNILISDYDKFDREKIEKMLVMLAEQSKLTFSLLENLLLWSRSQSGKMEINPSMFNLHGMVKENFSLLRSQSESKSQELVISVPDPCIAFADETMINTVLRNLLSNAVKFTPHRGIITVSAVEINNFIEISVIDTGIGISEKNLDNIFTIGSKISTPGTDKETGTGLGLILCKEFIEKNNGNLIVKSVPGNGSTFIFKIPTGY
jgi:PAS domain S-box-containing protein